VNADNGSDENNGSSDAPFATITQAQRSIKDDSGLLWQQCGGYNIVVNISGGTYDEGLTFDKSDSGGGKYGMNVYQAAEGESVTITGRVTITTGDDAGKFLAFKGITFSNADQERLANADEKVYIVTENCVFPP